MLNRELRTLYDRFGGAPAVRLVCHRWWQQIHDDVRLAAAYRGAAEPDLRAGLITLLTEAFGGPRGDHAQLAAVNQAHGVGPGLLSIATSHLVATLQYAGVHPVDITHVVNELERLRPALMCPEPPGPAPAVLTARPLPPMTVLPALGAAAGVAQ